LAGTVGLTRDHPEVRAGAAVPGIATHMKEPVPLVVEIVWKGVGTADIGGAWPRRTASLIRTGAATLGGTTGSLPVDPAATLTTIGTGGLPSQHGITGTLIRGGGGAVTPAWSDNAPYSVISTLPDDLVRSDGAAVRVAIIATSPTDLGLVGNGWYPGADPHQLVVAPHDPVGAVQHLLEKGLGADPVPDVLGVVVRAPIPTMDRETEAIVNAVVARVPSAVVAITATGSLGTSAREVPAATVARQVDRSVGQPVVADPAAGGFFLDQTVLARSGLSVDAAVQAMRGLTTPQGASLFADAFPSFSVEFSRYC
jgi:hypothetical protein